MQQHNRVAVPHKSIASQHITATALGQCSAHEPIQSTPIDRWVWRVESRSMLIKLSPINWSNWPLESIRKGHSVHCTCSDHTNYRTHNRFITIMTIASYLHGCKPFISGPFKVRRRAQTNIEPVKMDTCDPPLHCLTAATFSNNPVRQAN